MELGVLPQLITAIGALGTAAFGLVEASKVMLPVNDIGFDRIANTVVALTPGGAANALSQGHIIDTLRSNWINGTDLSSQKAIAKSLIKLNLSPTNAAALASETGVDAAVLTAVATCIATGEALTPAQNDVYGRFDLIVTALLDDTYQHSDDDYRNWTRAIAAFVAVLLAVAGGFVVFTNISPLHIIARSVLVGLLATPLAPIAKDLSTALATAVNAMQAVKKVSS
jgi:HAMP domain-containing protein